jgi:hypothetical protein
LAVVQHVGCVELAIHGQYADYVDTLGHGWNAGLKQRLTLSDHVDVSLTEELRLASYSDAARFTMYSVSLGLELDL